MSDNEIINGTEQNTPPENTNAETSPESAEQTVSFDTAEQARLDAEAEQARIRAEQTRMRVEAQAEQARIRAEQEKAQAQQQFYQTYRQPPVYGQYPPYSQNYYQPAPQQPQRFDPPYQAQNPNPYYYQPAPQKSGPEPVFEKKETKRKTEKGKKGAGIVALCIVFSLLFGLLGGLGGTYLYKRYAGDDVVTETSDNGKQTSNPTAVIREAVERDVESVAKEKGSVAAVAAIAQPSVVEIRTEKTMTSFWYGQYVTEGAGSGVIVTDDGYIVTNNHVINGASKITVSLFSQDRNAEPKKYAAKLIGTDSVNDLAIIKIEEKDLTPAVFGRSSELTVGELAVAIGNPLGELGGTVTDGIISALEREVTVEGEKMILLQTNAAVSPGNSGGGLFNANGELIGIVNSKSIGNGAEGLGFAIPIDTAKPVIEDIIENGKVTGRPGLGISAVQIDTDDELRIYGVKEKGIYVDESSNSELKKGDMILGVEGNAVSSLSDIRQTLSNFKVGDTITVTIKRGGKITDVRVTLVEIN